MTSKRKAITEVGPDMDKEQTIALRDKYIAHSCKLFFKASPIKIVSARGQYMYDEKGNQYLDCINNVAHVGHCHPEVVKAGAQQMETLNTNSRYLHDNIVLLGQTMASMFPGDLSVCFFVNSGSEANDLAMRLARAHTKAKDMFVLDHAYHGHTLSVIDISPYKEDGSGKPDWVHVIPQPDTYRGKYNTTNRPGEDLCELYVQELRKEVKSAQKDGRKICAFIAESMQSCGGQIVFPPNYLKGIYKCIRDAGGICIADEVQVGFGRVGSNWWAFETQGVVPDIVTMGKPMGNGHPISAVITTPQVAASFTNTGMEYFNTFGGNPVSCAVALSVIQTIKRDKLRENAELVGGYVLQQLRELMKKHLLIGDIRGMGFFVGAELVKDRKTMEPATAEAQHVIYRLKEQYVLFSADGPDRNVLKFKPPMCFGMEDAENLLSKIDNILTEISGDLDVSVENTLQLMHGAPNGPKVPVATASQNGHSKVKRMKVK